MPAGIGQLGSLQTLGLFVVGENRGCSISELKCLNLKGELAMKDLCNVPNAMDAREANLIGKERLQSLTLSWTGWMQESLEEVAEGLQPHRNLKKLVLSWYAGIRFPHWLQAQFLPNLVILNLEYNFGCDILPALGQLPLLKHLTITGMDAVRYSGNEFYGNGTAIAFLALETLSLKDLPNLEEWCGVDGREVFPRLGNLCINGCEKLKTLGSELDNLVALKSLTIRGCAELVSLPKGLRNLNALEKLEIEDLNNLVSFPEEGLQGLMSLKDLDISRCDKLTSLSKGLQFLVAFESLFILDCPQLTSLREGMQHLGSLHILFIRGSSQVGCICQSGLET